jgi:uncharacterized membrane protein
VIATPGSGPGSSPRGLLDVAGHEVRPLLLMFPVGLLAIAVVLDVSYLLSAPTMVGTLGFFTIAAGLVGGAVAVSPAGIDALTRWPAETPRNALVTVELDLGVLTLFAVVAMLRLPTQDRTAGPGLVVLEVIGLAVCAFSTWLGHHVRASMP